MHVNDLNYGNYTPSKSFARRFLASPITLGIILFIFAGFLSWYFFLHVALVDEKDLPLIKAESGTLKYRPPNAGELTVPHQDKLVYNRLVGGEEEKPSQEKFLPLPEAPLAGFPASSNIAQADEAPADDHPDAIVSSENKTLGESEAKLSTSTNLTHDEIASLISAIDESTTQGTPLAAERDKKAVPPAQAKPLSSASYRAQLASFSTAEKAKQEWKRLSKKHQKALKDLTPYYVKRSDKGSKNSLYVLQVGPFKRKEQAQDACRIMAPSKEGKALTSCRVIASEKKK